MNRLRSEFLSITSTATTEYIPIDLSGAVEVVLNLTEGTVDGFLTNEPYAGSPRLNITDTQGNKPLVVRSNDDRLYWVSSAAATSTLEIWVIRRG